MKIIATADHHFCETLRFDECLAVHNRIATLVEKERPDLFLSAGDVYHRASTPVERLAVATFFQRVAEMCPVIVVRGNHDRVRDLALLRRLRTRFEIVVEEAYGVHGCCACLAWPDRAMLAQAAGGHSTTEDIERTAGEAYRSLLLGLRQQLGDRLGPRILLAHALVDGAKTGKGQPLIAQPLNIPLDDLRLVKADIVILGHIHQAQQFDNIYYCGSPFRTEYGQSEEKRVLVIEFDDPHHPNVHSVSTEARPMVDIVATYDPVRGLFAHLPPSGSDTRLQYKVPAEFRAVAKEQAREIREAMLEHGAKTVVIEDEIEIASTSRVPELLERSGVDAQLRAYWDKSPADPYVEDLRKSALAEMPDIIDEFGLNDSGWRSVGTYRRVAAHGLIPFGDVELNLEALSGLVVLTGPNGVGKTTLLELIPGALYRKTATRGSLQELAETRDAWVELDTVRDDGAELRIRILLDGQSGKSEAVITPAPFEGTSVKRYDKWVAQSYPPEELNYASMFSPQGSGGWLGLDSAGRKTVILRAIGLERLEKAAESCRGRAAKHERTREQLSSEIEALRHVAESPLAVEREIQKDEDVLLHLQGAATEKRAAVESTRTSYEQWQTLANAEAEAKRELARLNDRTRSLRVQQRGIGATIKGLGEEIAYLESSQVDIAKLRSEAQETNDQARKLELELSKLESAAAEIAARRSAATRELDRATVRLERAKRARALDDAAKIDDAFAKLPEKNRALATAREDYKTIRDGLRALEAQYHGLATGLMDTVVAGINAVCDLDDDATELPEAKLVAVAVQRVAARKRDLREALPRMILEKKGLVEEQEAKGAALAAEVATLGSWAAREHELREALAELSAAKEEAASARKRLPPEDTTEADRRRMHDFVGDANKAAAMARERLLVAENDEAERRALASKIAERDALRGKLEAIDRELLDTERELGAVMIEPAGLEPDLRGEELYLKQLELEIASVTSRVEARRASLDKALEHEANLDTMTAKKLEATTAFEVWSLLGQALGSQGLQAALVDAIGPELTDTINELLHSCWGTRWTVQVKVSPVGSRREVCDLLVFDRNTGREFDGRRLSGGQAVIVGEAISMALAIIGARRAGQRVLVRDEPSGALDKENVPSYAAMLRKGATMVGAERVFLVTHQQELVELADHVLVFGEDGLKEVG